MRVNPEEVRQIATLARVGLTDEDVDRFSNQLSNILEQFQVLQQMDTTNVLPTSHSGELENVMQEDNSRPSLPLADILANAPHSEGEFFRIPLVLEQ